MSGQDAKELWQQGESALFKARAERRREDGARRKAGRKCIKAKEVKLEWEAQNGIWIAGLVTREIGFDNRVIEVDCHIYPPHTHSVTHQHNEAIIFVLRGRGYTLLDDERVDWEPGDTLYIPQGAWHQHHVTGDEPALVLAIKPVPLQEFLGELNIIYKGDSATVNRDYQPESFAREFAKINRSAP